MYIMSVVFALILLFISKTLALQLPCQKEPCPPGYFRKSGCGDGNRWNKCETCPRGYYTALKNTGRSCLRCQSCVLNTVESSPCTVWSDRQCVPEHSTVAPLKNTDNSRIVDCNPSCQLRTTPRADIGTTATTTTATNGTNVMTTPGSPSRLNHLVWVLLLIVMLPLTCGVHVLYKHLHLRPCWRDKLQVEAPLQTDTDRGCLQRPTTLDFTIREETPVGDVMCPVPPVSPAHSAPLLPNVEHRALPDQNLSKPLPAIVLYAVIKEVPPRRWKELLRLLSVADRQLERVELDVGLSSMERQYQQLRLWSQKPSAKMEDVYSALHYMELTGCAQMIRENLNQLYLTPHGGVV